MFTYKPETSKKQSISSSVKDLMPWSYTAAKLYRPKLIRTSTSCQAAAAMIDGRALIQPGVRTKAFSGSAFP
ncbi:MAG: hypothetical protein ACOCTJ_03430 [Desulfobia sp.]